MDNQLEWQDEYNIGVEVIDKEHRRLFRIIKKLMNFSEEEKKNLRACQEGVKYFKGHALKHFAEEEAYMSSVGYEGLERHRKIHKGFRENTLPALEQELEEAEYAPEAVDHFLGVCAGWLIGHTLTEDRAITGEAASKWEGLLSEQEQAATKDLVLHLLFDMFRLESQMISDTYGGEKFGRGVYYRLTYDAAKNEKGMEVLLAFEEKLLINTVGKAMGLKTNKLDTKLLHASRYTARQFVGRMLEHFPEASHYELKNENLLTYEQLQKVFDRVKPQVSLLFNTGSGYFAYCMISPRMIESEVETSLEADNALTEVEKYLSKREKVEEESISKPRVLVVDDSTTIRTGMKELLDADYEVLMADSGISAIRAITLDKPDLVLLDYEMPVCDGRQTLEMLRSVKEFASLPVVFLTGRSDPESVRKVMSLNPTGYLLKYLKPEEIKQKIDGFFAAMGK